MSLKKDFCQRAMAAKRGEGLKLIVTEQFHVDGFYIGDTYRTEIRKRDLFEVLDISGGRLHLKGKVESDTFLLSIPIAFASGCMEEVTDTFGKPEASDILKCFCGALAKEDDWESEDGEIFMVFCPESNIAFRSVEGPQAARDGWLKAMEKAASKGKSGWQPIETAPKDGTKIIAFIPRLGVDIIFYTFPGYWVDDNFYRYSPTHWIPVPDLPEV